MIRSVVLSVCLLLIACAAGAQPWALERLEKSPRHSEWVTLKRGGRTLHAFVTYPEVSKKATAVLVIHENRGLTDWVRLFTDQLAAEGFIVLAPDLLSGNDTLYPKSSAYPNQDAAREALGRLVPDTVTADLNAWKTYLGGLKAGNGKLAVAGFCWGGSQTFRFATNAGGVQLFAVFYGGAPADSSAYARIKAPVYGFYAGNDERVNASIPAAEKWMALHKKTFQHETYPGAGHAFMRRADDPSETVVENGTARAAAFERLTKLLRGL